MVEGRKAKVAVLISGGGTNLQAIIDNEKAGKMPHTQIKIVVSNSSKAYGLKRAEKAGIENVFIPSKDFENNLEQIIENEKIDIIVLAGLLKILSPEFVNKYPKKIINVHPALIPSFCGKGYYGLNVHRAALDYGVKVTGATVHFVSSVVDGGEIIAQKPVYIEDGDTPEILQKRVMEQAEWILLPAAVEQVAKNICEVE